MALPLSSNQSNCAEDHGRAHGTRLSVHSLGSTWFSHRCRISQHRTAVVDGATGESWSYGELGQRASQLAHWLVEQGVQRGDRVAMLAPNHFSVLAVLFACGQIGAIFVPLNWRLNAQELNEIVVDCTPSLLLVEACGMEQIVQLVETLVLPSGLCLTAVPDLADLDTSGDAAEGTKREWVIESAEGAKRAEAIERSEGTTRAGGAERTEATQRAEAIERSKGTTRAGVAERTTATKRAEAVDSAVATKESEAVEAARTAGLERNDNEAAANDEHAEQPWIMIYTGGTTGKAKGVVLSHRAVLCNATNTIVSWQLSEQDVTVTVLPMFHTGGLNALTLPILVSGGTVVLERSFEAERTAELLERMGTTIVLMVPTMYHMLVSSNAFAAASYAKMRTFLSGGAPCPASVYEAFAQRQLSFKEGYGATESGPNNFVIDPVIAQQKRGSIGVPMLFNEARIISGEGDSVGDVQEAYQVGELALRGGHLFSYYWNNAIETNKSVRNGWFMTGDLALRDEEGYYYIVGRQKELIITGGENVYPLEVERLLLQHPHVLEAAVIGLNDNKWGEVVAAVIVATRDSALTPDLLVEHCSLQIGKYKVPKRYVFVNEMPKTSVGKLDKQQMRSLFKR
ncbi:AMP-binding protein [Paenibacillus sp. 481]|uniref:AMP-binding protein n=1 Tax=Paenibacillus sp. 481 TaxID=2835869 RepID=UPI001E35E004|nr:AMP-binding protein [Paenibacillus sp. 481]UHA74624.1 AMP-binding protein [Paenibacillus sp. 481]